MPIPSTDEMTLPVLQHIANGQEYRRLSIIKMLTEHFSLTEDERRKLGKSGQMEKSLSRKGLIERSRERHYRITALGRNVLSQSVEEISAPDLNAGTSGDLPDSGENLGIGEGNQRPEKSIEENYQQIRKELAEELLQQIKKNSPTFFEELVIDLLVAMGYGGSREDAQAVGRSGDGGIDGIINEDRLGLDVIYVQAKRWEGNVGEPDIARFAGALAGKGANKGIFITTSDFTKAARAYDASGFKIILIDGNQLAQYMIEHNVGVSIEKTYEVKRVDSDYFAENVE
ncbi:MAG: restriction endonuclease [Candidatus Poribacteria bacterium]|nr:restriction endonuclease [Candidatus Poribacteria bacterium]